MKIYKGFEEKTFLKIAKLSESKQLYQDVKYARKIERLRSKTKIIAERLDELAFFIGYNNTSHFRLIGIGVVKKCQGRGYGRFMLERVKQYCRENGKNKIRTRTTAGNEFYEIYGGVE